MRLFPKEWFRFLFPYRRQFKVAAMQVIREVTGLPDEEILQAKQGIFLCNRSHPKIMAIITRAYSLGVMVSALLQ
jgi:hypothetical protein